MGKLIAILVTMGVGSVVGFGYAVSLAEASNPGAGAPIIRTATKSNAGVVRGVGTLGGQGVIAGFDVLGGGITGLQNTGLGEMLTPTTVAPGAQTAPAGSGAVNPG